MKNSARDRAVDQHTQVRPEGSQCKRTRTLVINLFEMMSKLTEDAYQVLVELLNERFDSSVISTYTNQ